MRSSPEAHHILSVAYSNLRRSSTPRPARPHLAFDWGPSPSNIPRRPRFRHLELLPATRARTEGAGMSGNTFIIHQNSSPSHNLRGESIVNTALLAPEYQQCSESVDVPEGVLGPQGNRNVPKTRARAPDASADLDSYEI